jgi:hypothetical protein
MRVRIEPEMRVRVEEILIRLLCSITGASAIGECSQDVASAKVTASLDKFDPVVHH